MTTILVRTRLFASVAQILVEMVLVGVAKSAAFLTARRNRRAIAGLAASDDRMLKDIGLSRSDVLGALAAPSDEDPSMILKQRFEAGTERLRKAGGAI